MVNTHSNSIQSHYHHLLIKSAGNIEIISLEGTGNLIKNMFSVGNIFLVARDRETSTWRCLNQTVERWTWSLNVNMRQENSRENWVKIRLLPPNNPLVAHLSRYSFILTAENTSEKQPGEIYNNITLWVVVPSYTERRNVARSRCNWLWNAIKLIHIKTLYEIYFHLHRALCPLACWVLWGKRWRWRQFTV